MDLTIIHALHTQMIFHISSQIASIYYVCKHNEAHLAITNSHHPIYHEMLQDSSDFMAAASFCLIPCRLFRTTDILGLCSGSCRQHHSIKEKSSSSIFLGFGGRYPPATMTAYSSDNQRSSKCPFDYRVQCNKFSESLIPGLELP